MSLLDSIFAGSVMAPGIPPDNQEFGFRVNQLERHNQELAVRVKALEAHIRLTTQDLKTKDTEWKA